ncbi:pilus (MSHA type) biogenesis protein MshL [Atopomonas sediminilitoris]|uniref:pilus (MSHA type) biogenesis protein MshL n=1 Tax=Atopomonas sediminilitoris TaxID=2919919 RepID=UPI001F4E9CE7|nr:pilus (MSHA type) biogenesis protein MshL [Atopomonas sediminilitoris]MCJ8168403.1 pilus (MSHA type) biogenesis protein MshL [Atopomonas sediminilitoris]
MRKHAQPWLKLVLLLGVVSLGACQSFRDGEEQLYEQTTRQLDEALKQSRASAQPPTAVQAALIPPLRYDNLPIQSGPRFDVTAVDMPAREFFLSLMEGAGQNLVVAPQVDGLITFNLNNVTLDEVLAAVRDVYGFDYQRTAYGYRILPNQRITRTYDVDYLNVQREGVSDTQVSSGQATTNSSSDSSTGGTTTSTSSSTVPASRLTTTSNSDVWAELQSVVGMIIGGEEGNSVVVNPQAGILVVRASVSDQQAVEGFLKQAQRNLQRQVVLEAKILEVRLNDGFQAGVDWSYLQGQKGVGVDGADVSGPSGIDGVFGFVFDFGKFEGAIQLLETQGEVRVLSNPRVSTLNNQKAVIKVGTDEYFVTDVSTTTTTTSGGTSSPDLDITLTPFFSGISLDVTPQIDQRDDVTLHVRPTISKVEDQNKQILLGDAEFNLPLALSTTRQSDSIVRARSGQVVVIGGLMQNANDNTDAGLPWANQLPFIGGLFKQQRKALQKSELVILLRPVVVADNDTWLRQIQDSAEAFKVLR